MRSAADDVRTTYMPADDVQMMCGWCTDEGDRDLGWDFTCGRVCCPHVVCTSSATALHKALWTPCFNFWRIYVLLVGPLIPLFWWRLLVTSPPGFKARVGSLIHTWWTRNILVWHSTDSEWPPNSANLSTSWPNPRSALESLNLRNKMGLNYCFKHKI